MSAYTHTKKKFDQNSKQGTSINHSHVEKVL